MTINRLSFKEGYPIDVKEPLDRQLRTAVAAHVHQIEALPEGQYKLAADGTGAHDHHLTVFENGDGIHRATPKATVTDAGILDQDNNFQKGGMLTHLPQDKSTFCVIGSSKDLVGAALYEVVIFTKGPSPVNEQ